MAYDHDGDLPEGYDFNFVKALILDPDSRRHIHDSTEHNYLNNIGHRGICAVMRKTYGVRDERFASLGAILYEIMTDIPLVGGDFIGTPDWNDATGSIVATEVAAQLLSYDDYDLETLAYGAVQTMSEAAPCLTELVSKTAKEMFDPSPEELRRVKVGTGLLRTLHISAAELSDAA